MINVLRATRVNDIIDKINNHFYHLGLGNFRNANERFYIIRENDEILASVAYYKPQRTIKKVFVVEKYRKKGFGSLLWKHCEIVHSQYYNNEDIIAFIQKDNIASQNLFKKNGYTLQLTENDVFRAVKRIIRTVGAE